MMENGVKKKGKIRIGKTYIVREDGSSKLCADIEIKNHSITLWFAVDSTKEEYLCTGRADAFVMAVFPVAVWEEYDIVCEEVMSERLHYQLSNYLAPALAFSGKLSFVQILASLTTEGLSNKGAVGTVFSEDKYSMYTITEHGKKREYPLTHITVFNFASVSDTYQKESFQKKCRHVSCLAKEQELEYISVDTNLNKIFSGELRKVRSFWNLAGALALQKLFAVYLIPAEYDAAHYKISFEEASRYDLLTVNYASTESLSFYLSGAEVGEEEKQKLLNHNYSGHYCRAQESDKSSETLDDMEQSIYVGIPYIQELSDEIRLCSKVRLQNREELMWFSVKTSYGKYLTKDRADAFLIGLLTTAMRKGLDIVCEAPVTKCLLYQLNYYLIPMMSENISNFYKVKVYAESTENVLECVGAVGTGWTGGVDSIFTCMQNLHTKGEKHKLTHLLITSNGAIEGDCCKEILRRMVEKAENGFAAENGLEVIGVDTNLQEILSEPFISVVPFRHAAVVLALQKLFGVFLSSSGYDFSEIRFSEGMAGYCEMVVLACCGTGGTMFYSGGGAFSRGQKLKELSGFTQAHKYLHPCIYALRNNCGICSKCIRTEAVLYGLGTLERFSGVFDVKNFERNKSRYFAQLLTTDWNMDCREAIKIFRQRKMSIFFNLKVGFWLRLFKAKVFLKKKFFN